jgi:histidine triad (HIT) family protein
MGDCLFCKIANGEISSDIVYESENLIAFRDIQPQAPVHLLIIPRKHISTLNDLEIGDQEIISEIIFRAKKLAESNGIATAGYRTIFNCNSAGGQEVYHIHLHLLGGRQMTWPPG